MTTYLGKSCSFCLPRVPFVNCRQFMYLVISLLVLRAGYGIWLYQFLIIAYLFTFHTLCVRTAKALARLCGCAGSPEPSLVAYVISTIIWWAGSFSDCWLAYLFKSNYSRIFYIILLIHSNALSLVGPTAVQILDFVLPQSCSFGFTVILLKCVETWFACFLFGCI